MPDLSLAKAVPKLSMPTVLALLAPLISWWFLDTLLAALIILWVISHYALGTPKDDQWINDQLRQPRGGQQYSERVNESLDWLDERLPPDSQFKDEAKAAWGWPLLDRTLRLAVTYPILFLLVMWLATGNEGRIGSLVVLPSDPSWWARAATLVAIASLATVRFGRKKLSSRKRLALQLITYGAGSAFMGAFIFVSPLTGVGVFLVAVILTITNGGAGILVSLFGVTVSLTVGSAYADGLAIIAVLAGGIVGIVLALVLSLGAVSPTTNAGHGAVVYTVLCILVLIGLTMVAAVMDPGDTDVTVMLIFWGVLPVWNGIFDYLSVGLTRWLVRAGAARREKAFLYGCYDLGAAILAFTGLGCALIVMIHLMNCLASAPLLDLSSLFNDLRTPARRDDYWWLYAMLFSTLVPTLLHLAVSLWSLTALIPAWIKTWTADQLPNIQDSGWTRLRVEGALTLMATVTVVVPLLLTVLIGSCLYHFYPEVGRGYLWLFEWFAQLIGAGEVPEPV